MSNIESHVWISITFLRISGSRLEVSCVCSVKNYSLVCFGYVKGKIKKPPMLGWRRGLHWELGKDRS